MCGKEAQQDVESFAVDTNGGRKQHKTEDQGQSSYGAPAAGKINKAGTLIDHESFRGKGHGEAGRQRGGRSKGIGKTHKKSCIRIQKGDKKRFRDAEMEASMSDMRRGTGRAKRGVVEDEAAVEELQALIAHRRDENQRLMAINLRGQLLADQIQRYIFH